MLPIMAIHPLPPMFVESHGGGQCFALKIVGNSYRYGRRVFRGIEERGGTIWRAGPGMRYAKVSRERLNVYRNGHLLGTWRIGEAHILSWWDLPILVNGRWVARLLPGGRMRRFPIDGNGLVTVLPSRTSDLFALYSTNSHWRILRHGKTGDRWTPWTAGWATDFTVSPDRLFVATGRPGGGYKRYGAQGPGQLWSYSFKTGAIAALFRYGPQTEIVFDDSWVRPRHFASILTSRPPTSESNSEYPYATDLLLLGKTVSRFASLSSGWEVHAVLPAQREFFGLHLNRRNMGFDFRRVSIDTRKETTVGEDVDALDPSTVSSRTQIVNGP